MNNQNTEIQTADYNQHGSIKRSAVRKRN